MTHGAQVTGAREGQGRFITAGRVRLAEGDYYNSGGRYLISVHDLYEGTYQAEWARRYGQPGIPMQNGILRLETNPRYQPLAARGLNSDPGRYWNLSKMPQVQRALKGPADAISGSEVRLDSPPVRPWHDQERAQRCQDLQLELCQRALDLWRQPGLQSGGWRRFVRETLLTAPVCGFAWFEILADWHTWDLGLYEITTRPGGATHKRRVGSIARRVLVPRVPEWRAPWAVEHWLTQNEKLIGVEASFGQSSDWTGCTGPWRVVIPAEKILLVTHRQVGSNFEGRSALREAGEFIEALRKSLSTQGLAIEINGLGELVIYAPPNGFDTKPDKTGVSEYDRVVNYAKHRHTDLGNGLVLPHGAKAEVLTPQSQIPDLGDQMDRLERMIMTGLQSESALIATQKHGSHAARSDASSEARDTYDAVFQELIADPVERLWAQMIQLNFPEDWADGYRFVPNLRIGQVEERDNKAWLETVKAGVDARMITPGIEDEEVVRDLLDLPALSEEAKAARAQGSGDMAPVDKLQQGRLAIEAVFAPAPVGPFFAQLLGVSAPTDEERQAYLAYKNGETTAPVAAPVQDQESTDLDEGSAPEPPPGRYDHVDLAPPQDVIQAAAWCLEVNRTLPKEAQLNASDHRRASTLSRGLPLSPSAVQRLKAYHDNTPDQSSQAASKSPAWLSWQAAGGAPGKAWVDDLVKAMGSRPVIDAGQGEAPEGQQGEEGAQLAESTWTPAGDGSSAGLFLRLPAAVDKARGPLAHDSSPAHITLLYAGGLDEAGQKALVEAARPYLGKQLPVTLGPLRVLVNPHGKPVVYQQGVFHQGVRGHLDDVRQRVITALEAAGVEVTDVAHCAGHAWEPHLTRGTFDDLAVVVMPTPIEGTYPATLEVWGVPDQLLTSEGGEA